MCRQGWASVAMDAPTHSWSFGIFSDSTGLGDRVGREKAQRTFVEKRKRVLDVFDLNAGPDRFKRPG